MWALDREETQRRVLRAIGARLARLKNDVVEARGSMTLASHARSGSRRWLLLRRVLLDDLIVVAVAS